MESLSGRLNRLALAVLVAFGLVAASLFYWGVVESDSMLARPDNPRSVEAERAIVRGAIYDRDNQLLARSVVVGQQPSGQPRYQREYLRLDAVSATGYYSLTYGASGAEAAYDDVLSGPALNTAEKLLHRPRVGGDIRLTIDEDLQQAITRELGQRRGAVVVIEVPNGAIRALVSQPSFDPNRLDAEWERLLRDPAAPLLNRVTQGIYQPGGALQTVILAAMLAQPEAIPLVGSASPVLINGLTLTCLGAGQSLPITALDEAYMWGCPFLFADATRNYPLVVQGIIEAFGLMQPAQLPRFVPPPESRAERLTTQSDPDTRTAAGTGQGTLTVTPLQMALVASVIANRGNRISPHLLAATRPPGGPWQTVTYTHDENAVTTQETAATIRAAMRRAVTEGAAFAAGQSPLPPGLTMYGHASIAYTGQGANSWFIGFIELPDGRALAAAVAVENTADPALAAGIGGSALADAVRQDQ